MSRGEWLAIAPDWPAPPWVRGYSTTRQGGVSEGVYASLNLASHVGDRIESVIRNRSLLAQELQMPSAPYWLEQVHGCDLFECDLEACGVPLNESTRRATVQADGAIARSSGKVCAVLTADCLPVLMCDLRGRCVAAIHAGWRGLASGVIERACRVVAVDPSDLLVWIGPAIGPDAFEVGMDVREAFVNLDVEAARCFHESSEGRWMADLAGLARQRLRRLGVTAVYGGETCTYSDPERFFSFRRDGVTGRMASLIWLEPGPSATRM